MKPMKRIKQVVAVLLACVMVLGSFTMAYAKNDGYGNNCSSSKRYNHIGISLVTEDHKYSLKEKPSVWYYQGNKKVKIDLPQMYLFGKNGKEFQSSSRWTFTNDTKFYIEAILTDGKNDREFRADIVNTSNYKGSGLSFYEYCSKYYCDDKMGIDMKLVVEELAETTKYKVTYSDGGVGTSVPVDNNTYYTGDEVTISGDTVSKEKYDFKGWSYNGQIYQPNDKLIMGDKDITLTAVWANQYKISYVVEGREVGHRIVSEGQDVSDLLTYEYDGLDPSKRIVGWETDASDETIRSIDRDIVVTAKTAPKIFSITYFLNGEIYYRSLATYGESRELLGSPAKESENFSGWTVTNDLSYITKDVVAVGSTTAKTFTVTYKVDGVVVDEFTVEYGSEVPASTYEVPEGYDFTGFELVTEVEDAEHVKLNMVYEGSTSIKTFTVDYKVNGEIVESFENVEYGSEVPVYEYPVAEGYDFTGFELVTETEDASVVKQDMVFEGSVSVKTYKVTYKVNGAVVDEFTVEYGKAVPESTYEAPEGYNFTGFELVTEAEDPSVVKQDMVFEGSISIKTFTVTYYLNGEVYYTAYARYGESKELLGSPANESENFSGWTTSGDLSYITEDIVVVGSTSVKTFTVTYIVDGVVVDEFTVEYGSEVPASTYEVPEGYDFTGFELITEVEDAELVKLNMTFEGTTSIKKFTVEYNVNGETVQRFENVVYGSEIPVYEYSVTEGYNFTGFELVTEVEDTSVVKQDMVFEGTESIKTFTVTYKVDDVVVDEFTAEYGSVIPTSTYEVPEGYDFTGFELVTEVEDASVVKQDMVFEGTTSVIVVEEEEDEDIVIDTPYAPGTTEEENSTTEEDSTTEEAGIADKEVTEDTEKNSGDVVVEESTTAAVEEESSVVEEEEEDIDIDTPFDSGADTGDKSNYVAYVAVLLIAAVGAMVVAYNKKKSTAK